MLKRQLYRVTFACFVLFFSGTGSAGAIDDSFGRAKKIEGNHFTIYYAPELELYSLARQLNVAPLDQFLSGGPAGKDGPTGESELAGMLDTLFLRVCDILDMHLYSFKGTVKICRDSAQLNTIYQVLFGKSAIKVTRSFYAYSVNTIYTSAENFQLGIIGQEMGHMIINNYFVVPPPEKVQEVLSAYVEFQLRNAAQ